MRYTGHMRIASLLLSLMLCVCAGASAESAGLDQALSTWMDKDDTVRFSVSMQLGALLPFTDSQLAMMNSLLAHTVFQASLERDNDSSLTSLQMAVDGNALFSLSEREQEDGYLLETSLLPNRVLQSKITSPIAMLGGTSEEEGDSFDLLLALGQAESNYQALIDACEPYAEKKRANYKIKGIGTAKWSQIARLTTEQSDAMLPLLRAVLKSGMDEEYRAELDQVRFAKGFVVALYKTSESGKDIAVYMKGNLIYSDGSTRRLAYQWAFVNNGTERKDTYKYEAVKGQKPYDNRVIAGSTTQKLFSDSLSIKGSGDVTIKREGITTNDVFKMDLTGKEQSGARTLAGSCSLQSKVTQAGETASSTLTLSPELTMTPSDAGAILSGTVEVESKKEKTVVSSLTFTFAEDAPEAIASLDGLDSLYAVREEQEEEAQQTPPPTSSIMQNAEEAPDMAADDTYLVSSAPIGLQEYPIPKETTTVSLDGLSESAYTALTNELFQNLAGRLLLAYSSLPEEETALLKDGMTDEDYAAFLEVLSAL